MMIMSVEILREVGEEVIDDGGRRDEEGLMKVVKLRLGFLDKLLIVFGF